MDDMRPPLVLKPIVLVEIGPDSKLRILQTSGVQVIVTNRTIDEAAFLYPEQEQYPDILAAVHDLPAISPGDDDEIGSARAAIRRIHNGLTIVAGTKPNTGEKA
jgi:hypothetical protein